MLLFRLAESQLLKLASPFMLDSRTVGGLGLDTSEVGFIYGTIGIIALAAGGILGGIVTARKGLKYWLLGMTIAMNIPNLVYVYLAYAQPGKSAVDLFLCGSRTIRLWFRFYSLYALSDSFQRRRT